MVRDLTAVTPATTLGDAVHVLAAHRVSGLPVVNEALAVIGFLSEKDVILTAYPYPESASDDLMITARLSDLVRELRKLGGRLVQDCMSEPAITAQENDDAETVAADMIGRGLKLMPVVRDGTLQGIVRRRDLALKIIEEGEAN